MFVADDLIGGRALRCETLVEPQPRVRHGRILIAQTLNQLHREGPRQRLPIEAPQDRLGRLHSSTANSEQPIGQGVGLLPGQPAADDSIARSPQIFDQHDS